MHSSLSVGADQTLGQLAAAARAAGLDAIASTEHNTAGAHHLWAAHAGSDLLVILGQEVVTPTGHWLALGIGPGQVVEWRYRVRDGVIHEHMERVRNAGGLCVAAHPFAPYPSGVFGYSYRGFDAVEVWNGRWRSERPWNADNESALAQWGSHLIAGARAGSWQPVVGNSDAHLEGQIGIPHNVVLAEALDVTSVLAAVRAGRCWIAESDQVGLSLGARCGDRVAGVGEQLRTCGGTAVICVEVGGVPSGTVSFHTDRGTVHRGVLTATGSGAVEWSTTAEESAFVRIEVRHPDGQMAALSNPVTLA